MINIFKRLGRAVVSGVGVAAGYWLWESVLKGKAKDLKDRLSKKESEKSWP